MEEGLIFVWSEKEHLSNIIDHFEAKGIKYVENLIWIILDPAKKSNYLIYNLDTISSTDDPFNLSNSFKSENYKYFSKSHLTLLIFRKVLFD